MFLITNATFRLFMQKECFLSMCVAHVLKVYVKNGIYVSYRNKYLQILVSFIHIETQELYHTLTMAD